jgi:hypothetical protein
MIRGHKRIAVIGIGAILVAGGIGAAAAIGGTDSAKTRAHRAHSHAAATSHRAKASHHARTTARSHATYYWTWGGRFAGKLPSGGSGSIAFKHARDTAPEESPDHDFSIFHSSGPDGEGN